MSILSKGFLWCIVGNPQLVSHTFTVRVCVIGRGFLRCSKYGVGCLFLHLEYPYPWPLLLCPQPIGAINFLRLPVCELYMTSKRFSNTGRILLTAVSSSLSLTLRLQNLKGQRFFMECVKFDVCPANVSYNIDKKNIWPTDQTTFFYDCLLIKWWNGLGRVGFATKHDNYVELQTIFKGWSMAYHFRQRYCREPYKRFTKAIKIFGLQFNLRDNKW